MCVCVSFWHQGVPWCFYLWCILPCNRPSQNWSFKVTMSLLIILCVRNFSRAHQGWFISALCGIRWGRSTGTEGSQKTPSQQGTSAGVLGYLVDGQVSLSRRVVELFLERLRASAAWKWDLSSPLRLRYWTDIEVLLFYRPKKKTQGSLVSGREEMDFHLLREGVSCSDRREGIDDGPSL